MKRKKHFRPDWTETAPQPGTIRSIAKYGAPNAYKHPSDGWISMMMQEFGMDEEDFSHKKEEGNVSVVLDRPVALKDKHIQEIRAIVGEENVCADDYSRVRYAYGKTTEELMELRKGIIKEVADIVVHPRDKLEVARLVEYCNQNKIPTYVFAAGSSVNFGVRPANGGVTLVLSTHMNTLLELNEENQTVRVQPGMFGPAYEDALNHAPEHFGASRRYTCGHFPQSFEYSTVGGWVVTLGSGQNSTYYGDA